MSDNFYTQSSNFINSLSTAVDPRTGLFSINFPVVNLVANAQKGPEIGLRLTYSPLNSVNLGFGQGFTLGFSYFNTKSGTLVLSSGETYKVIIRNGKPVVQQKKLDSFHFEINENDYRIIWKSGVVEVLDSPQAGYTMKMLKTVFSPDGSRVDFEWIKGEMGRRLQRIYDESATLVTLSYDSHTKITLYPEREESLSITLKFKNENLSSIVSDADRTPLNWELAYTRVGEYLLATGITYPTGLVERVTYRAGEMKFPTKAKLAALPAVMLYTRIPGAGQPATTTSYSYSDANYLGYGSTVDFHPDKDSLYGILNRYVYSSTETLEEGDKKVSITREYNNYHLQTKEETKRGKNVITKLMTYYAMAGKSFEDQPAQFQLPKEERISYRDNKGNEHSELTFTAFDEWGNPESKTLPDGSCIEYEYYAKEGDANCPADPHGFTRYLKKQTTRPAASEFGTPIETLEYTYVGLGKSNSKSNGAGIVVVAHEESRYFDGVLRHYEKTDYIDDNTSADFGRARKKTLTFYSLDNSDEKFTQEEKYSYQGTKETLAVTVETTGHDGITISSSSEGAILTGLKLRETDHQGNTSTWRYDKLGRVLESTTASGTEYQNTQRYEYQREVNSSGQTIQYTTQEDCTGNKIRLYFDGLGREYRREILLSESVAKKGSEEWFVYASTDYDAEGAVKQEVQRDLLQSGVARAVQQTEVKSEHLYDQWGLNDQTRYNLGINAIQRYNPAERISYQTSESDTRVSLASQLTVYDVRQLPLTITRNFADGTMQSSTSFVYDGLGRVRRETDALGNQTEWEYDAEGRVVRQILPDGSLVEKTYASFSPEALMTSIAVTTADRDKTYLLGTQSFDSIGRLTESTSGGRHYHYEYEGVQPSPSRVTTPTGEVIDYKYIKPLDNALESLSGRSVSQSYQYEPLTGNMLSAQAKVANSSGELKNTFEYTKEGWLDKETVQSRDGRIQAASFSYSLLGDVESYRDIMGKSIYYEYDIFGRVNLMTGDQLTLRQYYDGFGRLNKREVEDKNSDNAVVTDFTLDDFNREIERKATYADGTTLIIGQNYTLNDQVCLRTTVQNGITLREESYKYDVRSRLTEYLCKGSELPMDAYGKPISQQRYHWDVLNNMQECITSFGNEQDTTTFWYENADDPTQLTRVTHSHADYPAEILLEYDLAGRMIKDEAGRTLQYDELGRLSTIAGDGIVGGSYYYDALNRLVEQNVNNDDNRKLYYRGDELIIEKSVNNVVHLVKFNDVCLGVEEENIIKP
ncbi:hypothetical protein IDY43_004675 [Salmonella enterica]|nr:hypothetical protein [Salmonella enterica]